MIPMWRNMEKLHLIKFYITPDGKLFDVEKNSSVAHGGGEVLPFFRKHMHPSETEVNFYSKEEVLQGLINWKEILLSEECNKSQMMKLQLIRYFIHLYKSKNAVWDQINSFADFSLVSGIPNVEENWYGRDVLLKDILVQSCDYDSIESQLYRTITTSKFNIYETFYDYILHDYKVVQIPKKIYDEREERYLNYSQPDFMITDRELRLKQELNSICKLVPLEEREPFVRCKTKMNRYDFVN